MEGGHGKPERLLLVNEGLCVADDDEWEKSTGRSPEHNSYSENYWEMTETTRELMPGLWRYIGNADASAR